MQALACVVWQPLGKTRKGWDGWRGAVHRDGWAVSAPVPADSRVGEWAKQPRPSSGKTLIKFSNAICELGLLLRLPSNGILQLPTAL